MYLLDTNVLSELPKRSPDPGVLAWMAEQKQIVVSAITLEEIAFGVGRARADLALKLQRWFEKLLAIPPIVIEVDEKIACLAGNLRAHGEKQGRTIDQSDMLIAATALHTGRILVTRNVRHFEACGVALLNPFLVSK